MALMKYTDKFWDILDEISDKVADILIKAEANLHIKNDMNVEEVDKSMQDWNFDVKINGKWRPIKIGIFLREFFGSKTFSEEEIKSFCEKYNKLRKTAGPSSSDSTNSTPNSGLLPDMGQHQHSGSFVSAYNGSKKNKYYWEEEEDLVHRKKVEIPEWKWDPKNVRETFIGLTTMTYPHGNEEDVVPLVKNIGLEKDKFGNYYKIIGKSETMFTSHLDTADKNQSKVTL